MTAADLARIYGVSIRTMRRWAAADQWRRTTTRPVRYNLTDADRSWRSRRPPSGVATLASRLDKMAH